MFVGGIRKCMGNIMHKLLNSSLKSRIKEVVFMKLKEKYIKIILIIQLILTILFFMTDKIINFMIIYVILIANCIVLYKFGN